MAECERSTSCDYFANHLSTKHTTAQLFKRHYCRGAFTDCARHLVLDFIERTADVSEEFARQISEIIPTLSPNQTEKVRKLLSLGYPRR